MPFWKNTEYEYAPVFFENIWKMMVGTICSFMELLFIKKDARLCWKNIVWDRNRRWFQERRIE